MENVMTTVYLKSPACATSAPDDFFSMLPRSVWTLVEQGHLKPQDPTLLGILLDYKTKNKTIVGPNQQTLAQRLHRSVDTVQRSLVRLVAAGLVAKIKLRDKLGRRRGLAYDLKGVLSLLPTRPTETAKLRHGEAVQKSDPVSALPSENSENSPNPPKPQTCGPSAEKEFVAEANTPAPAAPPTPTELEMTQIGIVPRVAKNLLSAHGEDTCRRYLKAYSGRSRATNLAGLIVAAITHGWSLSRTRPGGGSSRFGGGSSRFDPATPTERPRAHHLYIPPTTPADPPDALDALDPAARLILEQRARAILLAEQHPMVLELLQKGRADRFIKIQMRKLLIA